MATYMLTWNPHQGRPGDLEVAAARIAEGNVHRDDWSVGNRRHLDIGSRVFLIRQGKPPKGVVASGFTVTKPEPKNDADDHSNYCDIDFTMVLGGEGVILSVEDLRADPVLSEVNWGSQRGGIAFTEDQAARLEVLWRSLLESKGLAEVPR